MHVLPQVRKLEEKHPQELAVVGVHAGKYHAERVTKNIRQAVLRLDVDHPVVNDRYFRSWREYAVNAWPTLVLVDPSGYYIGSHPGEITFETFDPMISALIQEYESQGLIDRRPLPLRPERAAEPNRPLAFPGKVLADDQGRLFISDSDHNRIVIVTLEEDGRRGQVQSVVGNGEAGMRDGNFEAATFHHPQGLALAGDTLYVADPENHAVRALDLKIGLVSTVAGTGRPGLSRSAKGLGPSVDLSSPWDLAIEDQNLYTAMAGLHQIWQMSLRSGQVRPFAGNGAEEIFDGSLSTAALAQPMGLSADGQRLYFVDAESSSVRYAELKPTGDVRSIVGTGLFDFGDKDGAGDEVRLQHPQGLAQYQGHLYVADTYNNKIKMVDPTTRRATTFLGQNQPGQDDGIGERASFYEPSGVAAAGGKLYIADTNNHAIRVADLRTREVMTLQIEGLDA